MQNPPNMPVSGLPRAPCSLIVCNLTTNPIKSPCNFLSPVKDLYNSPTIKFECLELIL